MSSEASSRDPFVLRPIGHVQAVRTVVEDDWWGWGGKTGAPRECFAIALGDRDPPGSVDVDLRATWENKHAGGV